MPQENTIKESATAGTGLPGGFAFLPPVSLDDLKKYIEHDPEGAEDFVALIRSLRRQESRPVAL